MRNYHSNISLPSPPIHTESMLPPLSDIAPIHYSSMSGVRSTDPWWGNTELRPILNHPAKPSTDPLPFNHDALTPSASPSPPINDHINWSPKSSQCNSRKGSIASLLNTDPELRQLDEEELRNGYQSHFDAATDDHDDNSDHGCSRDGGVQKRGRPSATVYSSPDAKIKKRKCATKKKLKRSTQVDPEQRPIHKGLRHFSKQVCNKVAHHGVTTYNEVADELAMEFQYALDEDKPVFDQKNVRRRVYDALNVLMAMDIIAKDKKEIRWLGIPSCFRSDNASEKHEADLLEEIKKEQCLQDELSSTVDQLQTTVRDHIFRQLILRQLIWRNVNNPCKDKQIFPLPLFLLCPSSADEVHIELSENQRSAVITCNSSLDGRAIFEDIDVLDRLNLDSFRPQDWPCDASPLPLSKPSINNLPTSPSSSTSSDA